MIHDFLLSTDITGCLQTERLILRPLTPEIHHLLFTTKSKEEIIAFMGIQTEEEWAKEEARFKEGWAAFGKSFHYFHLLLKDSGRNIGACGYHTWHTLHARAELGYAITDESLMNKGYMSEALLPILHYGFEEMKFNRIEAFIGQFNSPSIRLVEKFGFQREGVLRGHYCKNGKIEDSLVYGLLKSDYCL